MADTFDGDYLCGLGPDAAAAIRAHALRTGRSYCDGTDTSVGPAPLGWRDWGFRSWRIRRYLAATKGMEGQADAGEDPRR